VRRVGDVDGVRMVGRRGDVVGVALVLANGAGQAEACHGRATAEVVPAVGSRLAVLVHVIAGADTIRAGPGVC
jgi:hypothetical protein